MQEIRQFRVYGYSCEYCGIMSDLSHMRDVPLFHAWVLEKNGEGSQEGYGCD